MQTSDFSRERAGHHRMLLGGLSCFRRYLQYTVILLLIVAATFYFYRNHIARQLGGLAVDQVNSLLVESGWQLRVGDCRWLTATSVRITDVDLTCDGSKQALFWIDHIDAEFSNPLSESTGLQPRLKQVLMDGSVIRLNAAGADNQSLQRLISFFRSLPKREHSPRVLLRDTVCELWNGMTEKSPAFTLREIQITTGVKSRRHAELGETTTLRCVSDRFDQALFEFTRLGPEQMMITGQVEDVTLEPALLEFANQLADLPTDQWTHLAGRVDIELRGMVDAGRLVSEHCGVDLRLKDIGLVHRDIETPLRNGSGTVFITPNAIQVRNFSAGVGTGTCAINYYQNDLLSPTTWVVSGRASQVHVDPRLSAVLPPVAQKFFADFLPDGLISMDFEFGQQDGQPIRKCDAQIHDLSTTFHKFPYRLENCVGTGFWRDNSCGFNIQSLENGQLISVTGEVQNPGPQATFDVQFSCPGELPIEGKLLEALKTYPAIHAQVVACKPRGQFAVQGRFVRTDGNAPGLLKYTVDLKQCSVRHDHFDFPVRNVNGQFHVEGNHVTFDQMVGENLSSSITCGGSWSPEAGLALRFLATRLILDEQLRFALPVVYRDAWDAIRPVGQIPLARIDMRLPPQEKQLDIDILIDARRPLEGRENQLAITPVAFPYEIRGIAGLIEFADNQLTMHGMSGRHDRSWVTCDGRGAFLEAGWRIQLTDVLTGSVPVDGELLGAFPAEFRGSLERLGFRGNVSVSGLIDLSGEVVRNEEGEPRSKALGPADQLAFANYLEQPGTAPSAIHLTGRLDAQPDPPRYASAMEWQLRLDTAGASMQAGVELEDVHGAMELAGRYDDRQAYTYGTMKIDSLKVLGMQVTGLEGPIWIDPAHTGVGLFAAPSGSQQQQRSLTGQLFGGQVSFDGQTFNDGEDRFYVHATLANARLKDAAATLAPSLDSMDGTGQLILRLSGNCSEMEALNGEGTINMYNARIYELPVLLAALKQLRTFNEDKSAFNSCDINFGIKGTKATISRMVLSGDPITLIGNGQVDLDRNVNLNFFTVAGRNRIYVPGITELYEASSQNMLWINVDGTLDNPQTHRKIMPMVNDGLRELFSNERR